MKLRINKELLVKHFILAQMLKEVEVKLFRVQTDYSLISLLWQYLSNGNISFSVQFMILELPPYNKQGKTCT